MSDLVVIVKDLTVQVATGAPSEDCYGPGFSIIYAEAVVTDSADVDRLFDAKERNAPVILRCAMLDAVGLITKTERGAKSTKFVMGVETVIYRKPTPAWERVEPLRRGPA